MNITTFLLDLDDTLLGNAMNTFLPPYFAALEACLDSFLVGRDIRQTMAKCVQAMQANKDPATTNMAVFMAELARELGVSAETVQPSIDTFYKEAFPQLQEHTEYFPEAVEIVTYLLSKGYKVVIATNPLFPATAIEQRMKWAGVQNFPYTLITTMENSHFSKPDPLYYREILRKTDSTPAETWMVGDDPFNDIIPAHSVGIKTWWIDHRFEQQPDVEIPCDKKGSLPDVLAWLTDPRSKL